MQGKPYWKKNSINLYWSFLDTDYPTDSIRYPTLNWLRVSTIHYPIIFDYRSRSNFDPWTRMVVHYIVHNKSSITYFMIWAWNFHQDWMLSWYIRWHCNNNFIIVLQDLFKFSAAVNEHEALYDIKCSQLLRQLVWWLKNNISFNKKKLYCTIQWNLQYWQLDHPHFWKWLLLTTCTIEEAV